MTFVDEFCGFDYEGFIMGIPSNTETKHFASAVVFKLNL